jgi:hypothetical protein
MLCLPRLFNFRVSQSPTITYYAQREQALTFTPSLKKYSHRSGSAITEVLIFNTNLSVREEIVRYIVAQGLRKLLPSASGGGGKTTKF